MEPFQVAEFIVNRFPDEVQGVTEFRRQVSVSVRKQDILRVMGFLHDRSELCFNFLKDLCGVDYHGLRETRFEVVYHLYSLRHRHMIRIKAQVPEDDCNIKSVTSIWVGANWHERECFDMFGINFQGHPDMRRVLMPEDWEGHPLRKDYPLKGPASPEDEWQGFREVLETAERNREFEWDR